MNSTFKSYSLGVVPHLVRHDILRKAHQQSAHRKHCEKNFVNFCEEICRVTNNFVSQQRLKKELEAKKNKKDNNLRRQQLVEEEIFQNFVRKDQGSKYSDAPIDVIFVEDVEQGNILIFDSEVTNCQHQKGLSRDNRRIFISQKTFKLTEFYPKGYDLSSPPEISIKSAIESLKRRSRINRKTCAYPKRAKKVSQVFNELTFRQTYEQSTLEGDNLVQQLYQTLKNKGHKKAQDETTFYYFVVNLIFKLERKYEKRFDELKSKDEYVRWVCGFPDFIPKNCMKNKTDYETDDEAPYVDDNALKKLFSSQLDTTDFRRVVAIVREARIYTEEDINNNVIIFGGLKRDCQVTGKTYPFQDVLYFSKDASGTLILDGLDKRSVEVTLPTISQLPHENANLFLYFDTSLVAGEDSDDDDECFLDIY